MDGSCTTQVICASHAESVHRANPPHELCYEVEISANRCRLTRLAGFSAEVSVVRLHGGFLFKGAGDAGVRRCGL